MSRTCSITLEGAPGAQRRGSRSKLVILSSHGGNAIEARDLEFEEELPLGVGTFGFVSKGSWMSGGGRGSAVVRVTVAVKTFRSADMNTREEHDAAVGVFHKELDISSWLQSHENIVQVFGGITSLPTGDFGIVMEYADGKHLSEDKMQGLWSSAQGSGNDDSLRKSCLGLVSALEFLHGHNVVHRDLSPENILCFGSDPTVLKISDFSSASTPRDPPSSLPAFSKSNPLYVAPETYERTFKTFGAVASATKWEDIYSLSLVLFQIFSGGLPPYHPQANGFKAKCEGLKPGFPRTFPKDIMSVIERGYSKDPEQRPDLKEFRSALEAGSHTNGVTQRLGKNEIGKKRHLQNGRMRSPKRMARTTKYSNTHSRLKMSYLPQRRIRI